MSDSEERDASVLGKRARDGEDMGTEKVEHSADRQESMEDDDDDDDVGPMPMPAGADGHAAKKKRKGAHRRLYHRRT